MDGEGAATIPTTMRLLLVIEAVARLGVPITPTEVNAVLGLPKPTIHRLFATLEEEGFLQRELDGRSYSTGPRLRTLAGGVLSSLWVRTARQTILKRLSLGIGETCNITLPDGDAMIYLERVETEWPLRIQLPIGTRVPLYCTASGKFYLSTLPQRHLKGYVSATDLRARTRNTLTDPDALLAEIEQVRAQGYSLDREEFMDDMIAIAVPVLDPSARLMATLACHAPTRRFSIERALNYLGAMREAAADLGRLVA